MPRTDHRVRSRRHGDGGHESGVEHAFCFLAGAALGALMRQRKQRPLITTPVLAGPDAHASQAMTEPRTAIPQADEWSDVPAHEPSDANLPALAGVVIALVIGAFVMHAALWWLANSGGPPAIDAATRWPVIAARTPELQQSSPQLQLSPQRDLEAYLSQQQAGLKTSSVGDTNGLARIPIDRAMAIIAERGAARPGAGGNPVSPTELQHRRPAEGPDSR